jgi:hypothetical protein
VTFGRFSQPYCCAGILAGALGLGLSGKRSNIGFRKRKSHVEFRRSFFMLRRDTRRAHKQAREKMLEAILFGAEADQRHVEGCTSCTSESQELVSVLNLLDEWQAPDPTPYFETRLRARIRAEQDTPKRLSWRLMPRMVVGWRVAVASVLVGFLIAYGLFVSNSKHVSTQSAHVTSAVLDLQSLDRDADLLSAMDSLDNGDPQSE